MAATDARIPNLRESVTNNFSTAVIGDDHHRNTTDSRTMEQILGTTSCTSLLASQDERYHYGTFTEV